MLVANERRHYQKDISFHRRLFWKLSGCFLGAETAVTESSCILCRDTCGTYAASERYGIVKRLSSVMVLGKSRLNKTEFIILSQ